MALTEERKLLLLGLLRQTDMHGYLLNAHLGASVPITLKKPTAYNLLDRMERDGWVAHRDEPTGERPRKVYSVTDEGERAFRDLLSEQLATFRPAEFPSAVALTFLDALPSSDAAPLLRKRREAVEAFREHLRTSNESSDGFGDAHADDAGGAGHVALTYARRFADLEIEILDELLQSLDARTPEMETP